MDIFDCYGKGAFRIKVPMTFLAILNWKRGAGRLAVNAVDLAGRADLLPAFIKSPGLFYQASPGRMAGAPPEEDYVAFLKHCKVYEFSGGVDFEKAARYCYDCLK